MGVALLVIVLAWVLGAVGYHWFEQLAWVEAFLNAAMILGVMGPVDVMQTTNGKIFARLYARFSGSLCIGLSAT